MLGRLHRAFGIAPMTAATHALLDAGGPPAADRARPPEHP
jgi:hypothetical protein